MRHRELQGETYSLDKENPNEGERVSGLVDRNARITTPQAIRMSI